MSDSNKERTFFTCPFLEHYRLSPYVEINMETEEGICKCGRKFKITENLHEAFEISRFTMNLILSLKFFEGEIIKKREERIVHNIRY